MKGHPGDVYNVASGRARSIQSIVDGLLSLTEAKIDIEVDPERYRPSDIPVIYGDASKLNGDTGWQPEISLDQTISDVLNEWRERIRK